MKNLQNEWPRFNRRQQPSNKMFFFFISSSFLNIFGSLCVMREKNTESEWEREWNSRAVKKKELHFRLTKKNRCNLNGTLRFFYYSSSFLPTLSTLLDIAHFKTSHARWRRDWMLETHFATQNRIIQLKLQFLCVSLKTERFIPVDKRFHLFILFYFNFIFKNSGRRGSQNIDKQFLCAK
jgi:hypothetical protein